MRLASFLKPGLLVYEVLKTVIFATVVVLQAENTEIFTLIIFSAQAALFPLMALFLCVNTVQYKEYLPLYIAGKFVCIFAIIGWSIFAQEKSSLGSFLSSTTLLCFEMSALFTVITIKNDVKRFLDNNENDQNGTQINHETNLQNANLTEGS